MPKEEAEEPNVAGPEITETPAAALERAREAAANRDPEGMATALYASPILDGLVRRIDQRYHRLQLEDAQDAVAEAVEALYAAVSQGRRIFSLGGYLWKVASRKAFDMDRRARGETIVDETKLEALAGAAAEGTDADIAAQERRAEQREKALKTARALLPQLGQKNLRQVMGYIFDALEAGEVDVPGQEIADALGLSLGTVHTSLSRGFRRLERLAREKGLLTAEFRELATELSETEDEQHD